MIDQSKSDCLTVRLVCEVNRLSQLLLNATQNSPISLIGSAKRMTSCEAQDRVAESRVYGRDDAIAFGFWQGVQ